MPAFLFPVAVAAIICFNIELEILIPCFPDFAVFFGVDPDKMPLVISMNMLGFSLGSPVWSALTVKYGIRNVSLTGTFLFILGSLGCLVSRDFNLFLLSRFVQGLGAGGGVVTAFMIATSGPQEQISSRLGLLTGMSTVATASGPLVGNLLLEWRGVVANQQFLLLTALLVFVLQIISFPEEKKSRKMPEVREIIKGYMKCISVPGFTFRLIAKDLLVCGYLVYLGWSAFIVREEWGWSSTEYSLFQFVLVGTYALVSMAMGKIGTLISLASIRKLTVCFLALSVILLVSGSFFPDYLQLTGILSVWCFTLGCAPGLNIMMTLAFGEVRDNREYGTGIMGILRYAVPALMITLISGSFEPAWSSWVAVYPVLLVAAGIFGLMAEFPGVLVKNTPDTAH